MRSGTRLRGKSAATRLDACAAHLPRIWYNVRIMTAEMTRRLFGVGAALAEMSVCVVVGAWVRGTSPAELVEIYRANRK